MTKYKLSNAKACAILAATKAYIRTRPDFLECWEYFQYLDGEQDLEESAYECVDYLEMEYPREYVNEMKDLKDICYDRELNGDYDNHE